MTKRFTELEKKEVAALKDKNFDLKKKIEGARAALSKKIGLKQKRVNQ